MRNKKMIIIYISIIAVIAISLLGVTYGYVTARIEGNETSKEMGVISKLIKIDYTDGSSSLTSTLEGYFNPGSELTKTFTFKNTGNKDLNYNIIIDELNNTFVRNDITYELYMNDNLLECPVYNLDSETSRCLLPKENPAYLATNLNINKNETQSLKLIITYNESTENQIVDAGKTIGGSISVEENKLKNLLIYGNSVQNGTPTPETPIEVESVGDKTKNLFNETDLTNYNIPADFYKADNTGITLLKNHSSNWKDMDSIITLPAGTYTISNTVPGVAKVQMYDKDNNLLLYYKDLPTTFTLNEEKSLKIKFLNDAPKPSFIGHIQIEQGSEATKYEPYGKYKIPVKVIGDNLFDVQKIISDSDVQITSDGLYLRCKNHWGEYAVINDDFKENTPYTLKVQVSGEKEEKYAVAFNVHYTDESVERIIFGDLYGTETQTLIGTTNPNKTVSYIDSEANYYGTYYLIRIDETMLVEGAFTLETLPDHDVYTNHQSVNVYLDEPLRKVGDCENCSDYIDLNNKKLVRRTAELLLENYNWTLYTQNNGFTSFYIDEEHAVLDRTNRLSNFIEYYQFTGSSLNRESYAVSGTSFPNRKYVVLSDNRGLTTSTLQDFFKSINAKIYIVPTTSEEDESIEFESIPKIKTNSIIKVDTKIQPSNIVLE